MASNQAEDIAPYVFLGLTAVTVLVDAVSFLLLGRVCTANMTGMSRFSAFRRPAYQTVPHAVINGPTKTSLLVLILPHI
jgi:hypothetical protein